MDVSIKGEMLTEQKESGIKYQHDTTCLKCRRFITECKTGQILININEHEVQSMELKEHIRIKRS